MNIQHVQQKENKTPKFWTKKVVKEQDEIE